MKGTITQIDEGRVQIQIECHSACAHCQSNKACGFAESKEKEIEVETEDWRQYSVGDTVEVDIPESQGLLAVMIAYLIPAVLGLTLLVVTYHPWGELRSALATLAFFALYVLVLRLLRQRLQKKFTYSVKLAANH